MKRNQLYYLLPCLCLLLSCLQGEDAVDSHQQQMKDWFHCVDKRLAPIAETMRRIEEKNPFMDAFCQQYGTPLWDYADIYQASDTGTMYFWIPLYNSDYPNEIRSLWYFEMKDGLVGLWSHHTRCPAYHAVWAGFPV